VIPLIKKGLYAITPNEANTIHLLANVEGALQAGIALLQYRDKTSSEETKLSRAIALQKLCAQYATPLIINDNPELAYQAHAAGVHLGQGDTNIEDAREMLGEKAIIGITCHHDINLALKAQEQGAI
jgi:thiamine-phosphate pyrophosphorylase